MDPPGKYRGAFEHTREGKLISSRCLRCGLVIAVSPRSNALRVVEAGHQCSQLRDAQPEHQQSEQDSAEPSPDRDF